MYSSYRCIAVENYLVHTFKSLKEIHEEDEIFSRYTPIC